MMSTMGNGFRERKKAILLWHDLFHGHQTWVAKIYLRGKEPLWLVN